jgi:hypothetical protein
MTPYRDVSGRSGVESYETQPKAIIVRFKRTGDTYLYDYSKPGKEMVEEMKRLAESGRGLATYVSQVVKGRYAKKLYGYPR